MTILILIGAFVAGFVCGCIVSQKLQQRITDAFYAYIATLEQENASLMKDCISMAKELQERRDEGESWRQE